MQKYFSTIITGTLAVLMLSSCGGTAPTEDAGAVMTAAVGTMVASFFGTQTALVTPVPFTPTQTYTPFATNTPFPTVTSLMSPTYALYVAPYGSLTPGTATPTGTRTTATVNPGSLAVGCNNLFFIRDVTIPAGTVMQRNQDFTKTWKVQNNGTCDWLYQYILVPMSGDRMSGDGTKLQKLVKVNNWTELSVNLTAPNKPGTYTGYWRLSNGQGTFGATLMVSIVVSDPATSTSVPPVTNTQSPQSTNTSTNTPQPSDTPVDTFTPEPTSTP